MNINYLFTLGVRGLAALRGLVEVGTLRRGHNGAGVRCLTAVLLAFFGVASLATAQTTATSPAAEALATTVPTETRELWTGDLYSSSYRAGLCLGSDGKVRGVLLLRVPSGKVDVYHFHGEHGGGRVSARHSSGHSFNGEFDGEDKVSGTIKLKSGFTVKLKGQRTQGVELTDTCRPLPQE